LDFGFAQDKLRLGNKNKQAYFVFLSAWTLALPKISCASVIKISKLILYFSRLALSLHIEKRHKMTKYALVTGGSRGLGKAICIELAKAGYTVIINYVSHSKAANETLSLIQGNGGCAELLPFDVSNVDDVDKALLTWSNEHPNEYISVLVNNAGIRDDALMMMMQNEQWSNVLNIHLNGFFYVTRRLLKDMLFYKDGRIVNVVSLSGLKGLPGQTNYSAAKAGIIGATKALAQEVARRGVTVNAVAPGFIMSDMTKDLDVKTLSKLVPMNRFGKPEEVADLVSFLVSDKAAYITGQVISINGGLYM
jgi:3-oxoacyl-[acyl-carrier protein] reductase